MADSTRTVPLRRIENLPGFVVHWLLCGPFNQDGKLSSCRALKKDYLGGEAKARPRAGHDWQPFTLREGFIVNLRRFYTAQGIVSSAAAYLDCPQAQTARILLGSDDGFALYLNGTRVGSLDVHRGLGVDSDGFDVSLKKETNAILLKIEQNHGAYEFCLRVTDPVGKGIRGLRAYLDHPRAKNTDPPGAARTVSGYEYLSHKFATAEHKLAFRAKTRPQYRAWRRKFLARFKTLLGPLPKSCPLKPQVTEEISTENFRRRRVLIDLEPGFSIPCFITMPMRIPKAEKLPAVLCLHGHGDGKRDMSASFSAPNRRPLIANRMPSLCMQPGDVAFHHLDAVHYSGANTSPRSRCQIGTSCYSSRAQRDESAYAEYQKGINELHEEKLLNADKENR
jgi:hypothetical protein